MVNSGIPLPSSASEAFLIVIVATIFTEPMTIVSSGWGGEAPRAVRAAVLQVHVGVDLVLDEVRQRDPHIAVLGDLDVVVLFRTALGG